MQGLTVFARSGPFLTIWSVGWPKMHEVFKSLLPRYFLKDIYVKWSQFEFQTIWSNFHYTPRRSKFLLTIIVLANFNCTLVLNFFSINVFQKLQLNYSMDRQCWELSFDKLLNLTSYFFQGNPLNVKYPNIVIHI